MPVTLSYEKLIDQKLGERWSVSAFAPTQRYEIKKFYDTGKWIFKRLHMESVGFITFDNPSTIYVYDRTINGAPFKQELIDKLSSAYNIVLI